MARGLVNVLEGDWGVIGGDWRHMRKKMYAFSQRFGLSGYPKTRLSWVLYNIKRENTPPKAGKNAPPKAGEGIFLEFYNDVAAVILHKPPL